MDTGHVLSALASSGGRNCHCGPLGTVNVSIFISHFFVAPIFVWRSAGDDQDPGLGQFLRVIQLDSCPVQRKKCFFGASKYDFEL